ncbi:haloacid dehalogenase-like hydrolase [Saccharopolyspora sp. K220]|uniref:HAD family hydrolase n=1 Tax=Saccharopolyspora soli TaxID=2926618 RepID=UPI001F5AA036|nr:HAD family hydrolase [Saccharopolyspora soli]MCI2422146.1 haloacid dehalogenase-like hydrolase [Saccharopolyspora soli]
MAADRQTRLVLWDIDHTLIETRGVGREIYERVFPKVTGQPLRELAAVHGRTELDIIHNTLQLHDLEPTERTVNQLAAALADGYRDALNELTTRGQVLPGVWEALDALAGESGIHQSVLTGNTRDVARIKVEAFGLDRYLDLSIGAYGDDHRDRSELVGIARKRAAQQLGRTIPAAQVVLIGDTPSDVEAALIAGSQIIAVATGKYTVDDLRAAGAATTFDRPTDVQQLWRAITR